jgi:hypothetical protein
MKEFRIYTEDVDRQAIARLTDAKFKGHTLLHGIGKWEGVAEQSVIIEIIAPAIEAQRVYALAAEIKIANHQQAVLVTVKDVESELI